MTTTPQAYIAPTSVTLRSQLNQKNSAVAVLKHGERVSVLDGRRRFVKVATQQGAEGWLDTNDLLSPAEMERIQQEREQALKLPSEGRATAYETLNIHLDPSRKSPAFAQIAEGAPVNVLGRKVVSKDAGVSRPAFVYEKPKPASRKQTKSRKAKVNLKPPLPAAPKPPENWQHAWGNEEPESAEQEPVAPPKRLPKGEKPKPTVLEDWMLVRTENKQTGWVLARNVMMSIPDDVAQYASGAHITSFFDLGTVNDARDGEKHNWLWTTASGGEAADFDAWRVFLWNRRRHRFETSYRQRDLEGYFPVQMEPQNPGVPGRAFKLITRDDDGKVRQRGYLFDGVRVHLISTEDYRPRETNGLTASTSETKDNKRNWFSQTWNLWKQKIASQH